MNLKLLLAAAAVTLAPISASALVLKVESAALGTFNIEDGGAGDTSAIDDLILFTATGPGGALSITFTRKIDADGLSELSLIAEGTTTDDVTISASADDFGAGTGLPSFVTFNMNASRLNGGEIHGTGYVDDEGEIDQTTDPLDWGIPLGTVVGTGTLTIPDDDIVGSIATNLSDPFSMTIVAELDGGITGRFDASLVSQVPVPAGIVLMGTAVAGLGVMRRRKKKAA